MSKKRPDHRKDDDWYWSLSPAQRDMVDEIEDIDRWVNIGCLSLGKYFSFMVFLTLVGYTIIGVIAGAGWNELNKFVFLDVFFFALWRLAAWGTPHIAP